MSTGFAASSRLYSPNQSLTRPIAIAGALSLLAGGAFAEEAYFRLQLKQGQRYLDAVNCSDQVGLNPGSTYAGGACQIWRVVSAGDGWYRHQLKQGRRYLDAVNCSDNFAMNPGSDYAGGACQLWRFVH